VTLPSSAFATTSYGGSGDVTSTLLSVGNGCAGSYQGFQIGAIAICLDDLGCSTGDRVSAAVTQGAAALIIIRSLTKTFVPLEGPDLAPLPVLVVSNMFGQAILSGSLNTKASVQTNNRVRPSYSANLIAETPGGNRNSVIVVGAHLDSVVAGPGINDNGSGSATILQIAVEMARLQLMYPTNQVRFIWFGGEEKGLLGSKHYVDSLDPGNDSVVFHLSIIFCSLYLRLISCPLQMTDLGLR
jgi:hypothetical protein